MPTAVALTVPVASMAPLLTVTAELAIEPLTTSAPALTVVAPGADLHERAGAGNHAAEAQGYRARLMANASLTTLPAMDLLGPSLPRNKSGCPLRSSRPRAVKLLRLASRCRGHLH